jgi:hypothetical protein
LESIENTRATGKVKAALPLIGFACADTRSSVRCTVLFEHVKPLRG